MINRLVVALVVLVVPTSVFARGVDFKLSSDIAELIYLTEAATFGYGGADIGVGLFFNNANDVALNANILVSGSGTGETRSWQYGVGGKAYLAKRDIPSKIAALPRSRNCARCARKRKLNSSLAR